MDPNARNKLYAWGVKYVLLRGGSDVAHKEEFLENHVRLVFKAGPYTVFRVKYNNEPF